jgi:hypothetical protein
MSKPERELSRGEWASWLKMVARTSLAERLPPTHEPSGTSPAEYASELLAELRNVASNFQARPNADVIAEVREFRRWVEDCLKRSRRTILAEASTDPEVIDFARPPNPFDPIDDVASTTTPREYLQQMGWDQPKPVVTLDDDDLASTVTLQEYLEELGWSQPGPASTSNNAQRDPMWDEFLDGL